jgi:glycosyltransferase involved in cell wall biosynthesis
MRIAMFTDAYYPRINGVAISVHSYAVELALRGHCVCIVAVEYPDDQGNFLNDFSSNQPPPVERVTVVRISSFKVVFSKEDRSARLEQWFFVKQKMDAFQPDIIHVNSEFFVGYFGCIYAMHRKLPCIYTFHTMWEDYLLNYAHFLNRAASRNIGRSLIKFFLRHSQLILAPTNRIASIIPQFNVSTPVHLLPTGIPENLFVLNPDRLQKIREDLFARFPALETGPILLFAGRMAKEKNLDFLLDVLEIVKQQIPNTVLLNVGDGPYAEEFLENARSKKLSSSVFLTGYVSRNDLAYCYALADVFVFASKTETQGLVTAESMLAGLPVVAIGELGTADVMQGDNGGFMVRDDTDEFSRAVVNLLTNAELYDRKKEEALAWGKRWTIGTLTERLLANYAECIESKKSEIDR